MLLFSSLSSLFSSYCCFALLALFPPDTSEFSIFSATCALKRSLRVSILLMREVTSSYQAKALYSPEREKMSSEINQHIIAAVEPRGMVIERMLLRDVALPLRLQQAIQEKLSAEQEAARMQFVLLKEKQEAERKKIEAEGISSFQKIVAEGINDNLLKWKGIEATKELALSHNSKVVIIGSGKEGLPVILGGDTNPPAGQPAPIPHR